VTVSFWLLDYLYCGLKYDIGFPDVRHLHDLSCSFFLNFNIIFVFIAGRREKHGVYPIKEPATAIRHFSLGKPGVVRSNLGEVVWLNSNANSVGSL